MQAAVFLDRDDTLIHNSGDLGDPAQVRLIQGAAAAIGSLRGLGYKIIVVTNQGGVARGKYGEADVDAVHERINELVRASASGSSIDRFYYCPYHPQGTVEKYTREHPWRKPQPGMLLQAAKDLQLDLGQCWMIGDQMRDVEAGAGAGVRTILVDGKGGARPQGDDGSVTPNFVAKSLVEAVRIVAQQRKPEVAEDIRTDEPTKKWDPAAAAALAQRRREENAKAQAAARPDADTTDTARSARPPRPFRPWDAPPTDETPQSHPASAAPAAKSPAKPETPPAKPAPPPPAVGSAEPETAKEQPAPSVAAPAIVRDEHDERTDASMQITLRQILQELRNQRSVIQEFSPLGYLAIALQLVAALCLVASFMMDPEEFFKWLGSAIFIQLAVIAVLMFDRE